ncbi:hypothetical protein BAG01nite_45270 [Brevibacillus agri]|uniref:Uncharacterized protein n=1 Tax=Brevibacillus agri TaxID=51101 RepID=A0A3M8A5K9_9BACL|nr:hypothetical protein [Brevibacillus agri]ELK39638.1 hypothetical protein D478_23348 [Brevibacillus agri BAB-2500]MBY0055019.1 hypothetical protein [Brevibacillus agri]QAV11865.1 hypothetical protein BA6348_03305 [Brevibacillus agri]RNB46352.1 hypothetical protein EB820_25100 [Brevibacillus agri]GED28425.1 hypothetical protein BAG01nite_45270 [Brevibacillus agri]
MGKRTKLDRILWKAIQNLSPKNDIETRIKETMKRIAYEYKNCLDYRVGYEYFPLQQFRLLMEKVVNVMNLRKFGIEYYSYLEYVTETTSIKKNWEFIRGGINQNLLNNRKIFNERNPLRNNIRDEHLYTHKFYQFDYDYKALQRDSSLVIHDDNSTYKMKIPAKTIEEIKSIVLFFISNLFIPFTHKNKHKDYLKKVHRTNKDKVIDSGVVKEKVAKELKEIVRHTI